MAGFLKFWELDPMGAMSGLIMLQKIPRYVYILEDIRYPVNGGVDRTRTDHLSNANAALYQMSYYPIEINDSIRN